MGRPHCGYFILAVKMAQLLAAGCELKVLLADIHAFTVSKCQLSWLNAGLSFIDIITAMLQAVGFRLKSSCLCWKACARRSLSTK